uniref:acyltransferase family protein n=1 Tax=Massilia alkalitolerans TaxID=286638 RepID=UPI0028A5BF07
RAWEMLAVGVVYLGASRTTFFKTNGKFIEFLGFGLIVSSILMFSSRTAWPSAWATIPVIGSVLVLCSAQTHSVWTGSRIAQWLGTRSYSLYLWHWPIVVTLVYCGVEDDAGIVALALVATLLLGEASYRLVENPARRHLEGLKVSVGTVVVTIASLALAVPAVYIRSQDGIKGRLAPELELVFNEATNKNPRIKECFAEARVPDSSCTYGGPTLGAIVIGDSHAASIVRTVENSLPDKGLHVLDWTMQSCPTLIGVRALPGGQSENCGQFVSSSLAKHAALPNDAPLIIVNRSSTYAFGPNDKGRENEAFPSIYFNQPVTQPTEPFLKDFRAAIISTACEFAKTRPVYLVRPIPELKFNVPQVMGRALQLGVKQEVSITIDEYHRRNSFVWEAQDAARDKCGVQILDPTKYLCMNGQCKGAQAGRPLYYDDDHLSEHGANVLKPMFAEIFVGKQTSNMP